ncbi:ATP-binding cassette domain-containing protein [Palleronia sp. KMU-117]|uniref:thiamine ABC transporter ATP-binding protein n=1 Tax=Palleronia sp. KMU-117 TaxID=3434108 RepID=UPI003D759366
MLELQRLRFTRGDFTLTADWTVDAGQRVAIVGPSGAGKSTLLSLIAGFDSPDEGRILWQGRDLTPLAPGARPVSTIFQDQNLFPHLDVAANVGLGVSPALRLTQGDRRRVTDALARVGLTGLEARKPGDLSGGQQARVALARTLIRDRPLMLLDEAFSGLGPALKAQMLDLVAELSEEAGMTVLMVSHSPGDARRIADETIFFENGLAHPPRPTQALFDNPPEALRAYIGT